MTTNKLYKHTKCLDVVFGPTSIQETDKELKIQGFWFNISTGKVIRIELDNIVIKNEDLPNWEIYEHQG